MELKRNNDMENFIDSVKDITNKSLDEFQNKLNDLFENLRNNGDSSNIHSYISLMQNIIKNFTYANEETENFSNSLKSGKESELIEDMKKNDELFNRIAPYIVIHNMILESEVKSEVNIGK